jgi:hypothetical protein
MERDEVGDVVDSVPEGRVGNKKPTQKNHLKNTNNGFFVFFLIFNFFMKILQTFLFEADLL